VRISFALFLTIRGLWVYVSRSLAPTEDRLSVPGLSRGTALCLGLRDQTLVGCAVRTISNSDFGSCGAHSASRIGGVCSVANQWAHPPSFQFQLGGLRVSWRNSPANWSIVDLSANYPRSGGSKPMLSWRLRHRRPDAGSTDQRTKADHRPFLLSGWPQFWCLCIWSVYFPANDRQPAALIALPADGVGIWVASGLYAQAPFSRDLSRAHRRTMPRNRPGNAGQILPEQRTEAKRVSARPRGFICRFHRVELS
jgi:hypothetical protein